MTIGYIESIGDVPASKGCARAVREAVEALKLNKHNLVELKELSEYMEEFSQLYRMVVSSDNLNFFEQTLGNEPTIKDF